MKTPVILLIVHMVAFGLMLIGAMAHSEGMNAVSALGLALEFPGWFLANMFLFGAVARLAFAFCFNGVLFVCGGLLIDRMSRPQRG